MIDLKEDKNENTMIKELTTKENIFSFNRYQFD